MLKKHLKFMYYNLSQTDNTGIANNSLFFSIMIIFVLISINGIQSMGVNVGLAWFSYIFMLLFSNTFANIRHNKLLKGLPVTDSFVVTNILLVSPMIYSFVIMVIIGVIYINYTMFSDGMVFDINKLRQELSLSNIARLINPFEFIFTVCIMAGVWFVIVVQGFYRDKARRETGYIIILLISVAVIVAVNFIMRSAGVKVDYDISEIIYVLPRIPCVIFSVAFAFITGIYAWKKCLYLYRYDIQGQKTIKPQGNRTSKFLPLKEFNRKKTTAIVVFIIIVVLVPLSIILFSNVDSVEMLTDSKKGAISVETKKPSEYDKWEYYFEKDGIPECMYEDDYRMIIFPESINDSYVKEYYACIDGKYSYEMYGKLTGEDDIDSILYNWAVEGARFLVADYPAEEFEKECDRIANLTYSNEDEEDEEQEVQVNHMLVDKENFSETAYIARYDYSSEEYEYALIDEKAKRIIYVFLSDCEDIPTQIQYKAKYPSKVISPKKRNFGKGYSIYQE